MVLDCPSPCENLVQFMRRHGGRLDEEKAQHITRQAAHMSCLRGILHRDIKLDNLLINSETSEVKLVDFGCGDILRSSPYRSYSGTAAYCPPEYHVGGMYYGRQATAWSLGVLMFLMLCGHFPRDDAETEALVQTQPVNGMRTSAQRSPVRQTKPTTCSGANPIPQLV